MSKPWQIPDRQGDRIQTHLDKIIGHLIKAKTEKNNVHNGYKATSFELYEGKGIDSVADVFNTALEDGLITQRGSIYQFNGETISRGKLNSIEELRANSDLITLLKMEMLNV